MTESDALALPSWLDVSRETVEQLMEFIAILTKWNSAINLVSKSSLPSIWNRHLLDSAQLFMHIPPQARLLLDLGSGGGFPGMVLAILAQASRPQLSVTLVEADRRKATFLAEAARHLAVHVTVLPARIEDIPPQMADVLTARALAPLVTLCGYAQRHLAADGTALFSKGYQAEDEIDRARRNWNFDVTRLQSRLDPAASILALTGVRHA